MVKAPWPDQGVFDVFPSVFHLVSLGSSRGVD